MFYNKSQIAVVEVKTALTLKMLNDSAWCSQNRNWILTSIFSLKFCIYVSNLESYGAVQEIGNNEIVIQICEQSVLPIRRYYVNKHAHALWPDRQKWSREIG